MKYSLSSVSTLCLKGPSTNRAALWNKSQRKSNKNSELFPCELRFRGMRPNYDPKRKKKNANKTGAWWHAGRKVPVMIARFPLCQSLHAQQLAGCASKRGSASLPSRGERKKKKAKQPRKFYSTTIMEMKYFPENLFWGFEKVWLLSRHKHMEIVLPLSDKKMESDKWVLFSGAQEALRGRRLAERNSEDSRRVFNATQRIKNTTAKIEFKTSQTTFCIFHLKGFQTVAGEMSFRRRIISTCS